MLKIWKVITSDVIGTEPQYFASPELVKQSVEITYSKWTVKPAIETERADYLCWRVPDGSVIEAHSIEVKDRADHL